MVRGLYISATGMTAQQWRMDAVSNNLANVNTAGFKRDMKTLRTTPVGSTRLEEVRVKFSWR